jgi:hypothetical protein
MAQPVVTANAFYRLRFLCFMQNQLAVNVVHYQCTVVGGNVTLQQLADAMGAIIGPLYKACLCSIATYKGLTLQLLQPPVTYTQVVSTVGAGTGLPGSDPQPKQVSGLISVKTDFAGRAFRGRLYVPFPPKAVADITGNVDGVTHASYVSLGTQLFQQQTYAAPTIPVTLIPVLFHRPPVGGGPAPGPTPIVSFGVTYNWATQRRRGDFGRPNVSPI